MFRFRLSTLFVVTTLVAVLTFAWMRYVVPNVTSVRIANGQVIFLLPVKNNSLGDHLLRAHLDASVTDERDNTFSYLQNFEPPRTYDTYNNLQYALSYSLLHVVLTLLVFLLGVLLLSYGMIVVVRKCRHRS